jgi:hypothetical protein
MERLSMRKIREVLHLRYEVGLSARQVAASVQIARSSVGEYERRLAAAGLSWLLPEEWSDSELERRLFPWPPPPTAPLHYSRPQSGSAARVSYAPAPWRVMELTKPRAAVAVDG